ncbi:MAG: serine protease [Brasilonema octagenarum HA4186-MV1]|jgi:V8-like Glu-specific endopeptidase|nr:serine protease [Brasilonema octagenarum HA4186-MV1]
MHLTGPERKKLRDAILSAYRSKADLEMMVDDELEENLDAIAGGANLTQVVFNLMKWAEARGKLDYLIIAAHETNPDNQELKKFYKTIFQQRFIINTAPINITANTGPEIDWLGPTEELQLQGLFQSEPDFWDVGFLKRAIEQITSVCRIEINSRKIGTGVLIADNLVLTNYHVLKPNENGDMQTNALNAVLRFGCLSSNSGNETDGLVFKLESQQPILHSSPIDKLDYVLLQVEKRLLDAKDIKPACWDANYLPVKGMGIHLLQHPEGDSMKISISRDGITGFYQERGLVQYVNKTALGSSGAPCFDDDWKIVALHHAQRAKSFGTIREGILFSAIYQEIKDYLKR